MENIFDRAVADDLIARIGRLTRASERGWGTMSPAQMLAHCSKPFDTVYDAAYLEANPPPNALLRGVLRLIAKPLVVGERPYKRNMRTAPAFIIKGERDFKEEQARLVAYVDRVQGEGEASFDGKESHSFGPLTAREWSTLFYKHTDHHLQQFGV